MTCYVPTRVLLLGKSPKFENVVRELYPYAEVQVVSWRGEKQYSGSPDLIVVCGYDYASSCYAYHQYLNVNVNQPFMFVSHLASNNTKVLYIDTEFASKIITFSRYRYAKNQLASLLQKRVSHFFILHIPTVVNENSQADIFGGMLFKLIFNAFIRFKVIQTITLLEVKAKTSTLLNSEPSSDVIVSLQPKWLRFKRTLFIDRLLRFLNG